MTPFDPTRWPHPNLWKFSSFNFVLRGLCPLSPLQFLFSPFHLSSLSSLSSPFSFICPSLYSFLSSSQFLLTLAACQLPLLLSYLDSRSQSHGLPMRTGGQKSQWAVVHMYRLFLTFVFRCQTGHKLLDLLRANWLIDCITDHIFIKYLVCARHYGRQ